MSSGFDDRRLVVAAESDQVVDDLVGALARHFSGGEAGVEGFEPAVVVELRRELARGELVGADLVQLWRMLGAMEARLPAGSASWRGMPSGIEVEGVDEVEGGASSAVEREAVRSERVESVAGLQRGHNSGGGRASSENATAGGATEASVEPGGRQGVQDRPCAEGSSEGTDGRAVNLLNLACGHCEEAAVLAAFFGRGGRRVRFFGMDVRDREIETARRRYQATEAVFRRLGVPQLRGEGQDLHEQFIADDATRLFGYREIPRQFEVVFLRHQNVWHDRDIWRRIFEFALARLAPRGVLVLTSYFDREHLIALELLKTLGAELLVSLENPRSRPLSYPGKSVDRHVAALRREEGGALGTKNEVAPAIEPQP